jgi:hypothetical protein
MDSHSSDRSTFSLLPLFLMFSLATNFVQYALATNGIANLERDVFGYQQKITQLQTEKNICEGKFQGFVEGRR